MYSFFNDMGNYEQRKVAEPYKEGGLLVSTCKVSDGKDPYETGVEHPLYNAGKIIIVQSYKSKEKALAGHSAWIKKMTADILPSALVDCCNSAISILAFGFSGKPAEFKKNAPT